ILVCAFLASVHAQNAAFNEVQTSQVLGVLSQASPLDQANIFPDYLFALMPEIMSISRNLKSRDVIDTMMAYMPIARRIIEYQSLSEGTGFTIKQEQALSFSERVIPPMMQFVRELNGNNPYLNNLPLNEAPDEATTTLLLDLLPDVQATIRNLKHQYGGWPGMDKSLEVLNAFMPIARKTIQYRAKIANRPVSEDEELYLNFAEQVVPPIMAYAQNLFEGKTITSQQANILQLIAGANRELNAKRLRSSVKRLS
ncbi:unnamed protein product, partial [Meganyctiphanes norvegica]